MTSLGKRRDVRYAVGMTIRRPLGALLAMSTGLIGAVAAINPAQANAIRCGSGTGVSCVAPAGQLRIYSQDYYNGNVSGLSGGSTIGGCQVLPPSTFMDVESWSNNTAAEWRAYTENSCPSDRPVLTVHPYTQESVAPIYQQSIRAWRRVS
jgi:hypothetical protein